MTSLTDKAQQDELAINEKDRKIRDLEKLVVEKEKEIKFYSQEHDELFEKVKIKLNRLKK